MAKKLNIAHRNPCYLTILVALLLLQADWPKYFSAGISDFSVCSTTMHQATTLTAIAHLLEAYAEHMGALPWGFNF
jgi:hypothetical protein